MNNLLSYEYNFLITDIDMKYFYLLIMLLLLQVEYYKRIISRDAVINMKQSFFQPLDKLPPLYHRLQYYSLLVIQFSFTKTIVFFQKS